MSGVPDAQRHRLELAIDRVLDQRYRILQALGAGGSSQVYLAHDQALGREVAIKVLDQEAAKDGALRKRFVREARALAALSHPNIVSVFDVGEVDGLPFIVMERLESSLRARIEHEGALEIGEAVRIATEVAAGLAAAHARGIIHADMKPSNILFDTNGRAKIADFGIARTPQDSAETPQLYATALYVAPERVEGHPATPASDIYGLGLVLYEMLVGKPPFTSSNPTVLLRDHVVRPPIPPSHLRTSLPRELDDVVLKALAKQPSLRYAKATDFSKALTRLEGVDQELMTVQVRNTGQLMPTPLEGLLPYRTESPVVALLARHAQPLRRVFYTALLVLPLWALLTVAGVPLPYTALFVGLPAMIALAGHLSLALAICWIAEGLMLFLFVPFLSVLFLLTGLWLAVREYSAEQATFALALPVTAPLGLAPALILGATALHGLSGILAVAWGAVMTVIVTLAQGQPSGGPFVVSGLLFHQDNFFDTLRAISAREAFSDIFRAPSSQERFQSLTTLYEPRVIADQIIQLVSRVAGADPTTMLGTIAAWVLGASMVWVVVRVFRIIADSVLRPQRWYALYILATALGTVAGALLLFGLFVTSGPLANSPDAAPDAVLFLSALTGAVLALAATVVLGATKPIEPVSEDLTEGARRVRAAAR